MLRGEILRFIAEEVSGKGGTSFSVVDVYVLAAMEEVLSCFEGDVIQPFAVAAISVLAPTAYPGTVSQKFGNEVSEIFSELAFLPGAWHLSIARAARIIAEEKLSNLHARSAIAVLAAEVERVAEAQKVNSLSEQIEVAGKTANAEIKKIIEILLQKLSSKELNPAPEEKGPVWLIALSIDVAASTEAKTRMKKLAASDDRLTELYKQFYNNFLFNEDRFYRSIFRADTSPGTAKLDWRRLFVVKGIGDEVWLLYEIPREDIVELSSAMARLIESGFELVERTLSWSGGEHIEEPFDNLIDEFDQSYDRMDLPFKCFADLITDGLEISEIRAEFLEKQINVYVGKENASPKGVDYVDFGNRLNIGTVELSGRTSRLSRRSDYIGHEIDRFFRATKAALPGVFTLGESLFNKMAVTSKHIEFPGLSQGTLTYKNSITKIDAPLTFIYGRRELSQDDMKGIGKAYSAYCLVTLPLLRRLHSGGLFNTKHVIAPTLDLFPKESLGSLG